MRVKDFAADCPGTLVPVQGVTGASHAFVPAPLPADWVWPNDLWPLLLDARVALASLSGIGEHLPDSNLILRPLQTREAVRSSNLEGTYTTPEQQALFDLEPRYAESSDDPANAQREIFNYATALRLRQERRAELPISLRLIRELHAVLMEGVRGSDRNPGSFRTMQNQIGKPARYLPPPPSHLQQSLDRFEKHLHAPRTFDPLVEAFMVHYQFEAIHPFMDGNGRVGRLLLAILIEEWCELSKPWLYMSAYFEANRDDYIDHLYQVSTKGDWRNWIEFCLRGVIEQARDTRERCEKLLSVHRDFHQRIQRHGGSVRLSSIVDSLFITPVARVPRIAERHNVTYPTAKSDLEKLLNVGILTQLPIQPQIAYYCRPILDIIYAD